MRIVLKMKNNIDLKVDKMKKKTIGIVINVVLYIIFSILFTSKGFALMLAKEASKAHIVHNKYGKSYSYLEFNAISPILYRIGAIGVCITGLVVLISLTYITYKEIVEQRISVISKDTIANLDENKKVKTIFRNFMSVIIIFMVYAFFLWSFILLLKNSFFSEVGTEGVYFDLF